MTPLEIELKKMVDNYKTIMCKHYFFVCSVDAISATNKLVKSGNFRDQDEFVGLKIG